MSNQVKSFVCVQEVLSPQLNDMNQIQHYMPSKCSGPKFLLTAICNLCHHYAVRPGSLLSVWLYLITENSKEEQTVPLFPSAFITKNVWLSREKPGAQIAVPYNPGLADCRTWAEFIWHCSIPWSVTISCPHFTAENRWIRRELTLTLVTSSNFQAGRISEGPTAPNAEGYSINGRTLLQPAHKQTDPEETGPISQTVKE